MPLALCVIALAAWTSSAVAGAGSAAPGIVVSADLAPALSGEIYRIDRDGRRADLSRSPFQDTQPLVSPDGRTVAFVSDRTGRTAVYAVGVDGSGLRRISSALAQPRLVGWSPDGRDILTSVGLTPPRSCLSSGSTTRSARSSAGRIRAEPARLGGPRTGGRSHSRAVQTAAARCVLSRPPAHNCSAFRAPHGARSSTGRPRGRSRSGATGRSGSSTATAGGSRASAATRWRGRPRATGSPA